MMRFATTQFGLFRPLQCFGGHDTPRRDDIPNGRGRFLFDLLFPRTQRHGIKHDFTTGRCHLRHVSSVHFGRRHNPPFQDTKSITKWNSRQTRATFQYGQTRTHNEHALFLDRVRVRWTQKRIGLGLKRECATPKETVLATGRQTRGHGWTRRATGSQRNGRIMVFVIIIVVVTGVNYWYSSLLLLLLRYHDDIFPGAVHDIPVVSLTLKFFKTIHGLIIKKDVKEFNAMNAHQVTTILNDRVFERRIVLVQPVLLLLLLLFLLLLLLCTCCCCCALW